MRRDWYWKDYLDHIGKKRLHLPDCNDSMQKIILEYAGDLSLTQIQKKALKVMLAFHGTKEEVIEHFMKNGIKRTTAYSTLDRLVSLGLIRSLSALYRISGKARILAINYPIDP